MVLRYTAKRVNAHVEAIQHITAMTTKSTGAGRRRRSRTRPSNQEDRRYGSNPKRSKPPQ